MLLDFVYLMFYLFFIVHTMVMLLSEAPLVNFALTESVLGLLQLPIDR